MKYLKYFESKDNDNIEKIIEKIIPNGFLFTIEGNFIEIEKKLTDENEIEVFRQRLITARKSGRINITDVEIESACNRETEPFEEEELNNFLKDMEKHFFIIYKMLNYSLRINIVRKRENNVKEVMEFISENLSYLYDDYQFNLDLTTEDEINGVLYIAIHFIDALRLNNIKDSIISLSEFIDYKYKLKIIKGGNIYLDGFINYKNLDNIPDKDIKSLTFLIAM